MIWTEKFDIGLQTLDIYRRYPELLPLIGTEYGQIDKKVLILGESHYLPEKSHIHLDHTTWYDSSSKDLNDTERKWIFTRQNAGNGKNQKYESKAFSIFRNIETAILELQPQSVDTYNLFRYTVFLNYFLRPAQTGESIVRHEMDKTRSFWNICALQSILDYEYLIFVSRIAYNDFDWYYRNVKQLDGIKYFSVPHPSSSWWNTKSLKYGYKDQPNLTGKEKFQKIVSEIGLFDFGIEVV